MGNQRLFNRGKHAIRNAAVFAALLLLLGGLLPQSAWAYEQEPSDMTSNRESSALYAMDVAAFQDTRLPELKGQQDTALDQLNSAKNYYGDQLNAVERLIYDALVLVKPGDPASVEFDVGDADYSAASAMAERAFNAFKSDYPEADAWMSYITVGQIAETTYSATIAVYDKRGEGWSSYLHEYSLARADQIAKSVPVDATRWQKVRYVFDVLETTSKYDPSSACGIDGNAAFVSSMVGVFYAGYGTCQGYADAFKLLCDKLEVPCIIVGNEGHAWNYVLMEDGAWYAIDASISLGAVYDNSDRNIDDFVLMGASNDHLNQSIYQGQLMIGYPGDFVFPVQSVKDYQRPTDVDPLSRDITAPFEFDQTNPVFLYEVNDDRSSCTIVGYEGAQSGDLVVPASIDGHNVTAIGASAFAFCSGFDGALLLPNGLQEIGAYAFTRCSGLTGALNLPDSLESIDAMAFLGCSGIETIAFGSSLREMGFRAFAGCTSLRGDAMFPESLKQYGGEAYVECSSLDGAYIVRECVDFSGLELLGTGISAIVADPANKRYLTSDGILYSSDGKKLIACPKNMTGSISFRDGVEVIGKNAFERCEDLTGDLIIPDSVRTIEDWAFSAAFFFEGVGTLSIPSGVTIGRGAFQFAHGERLVLRGPVEAMDAESFSFDATTFDEIEFHCTDEKVSALLEGYWDPPRESWEHRMNITVLHECSNGVCVHCGDIEGHDWGPWRIIHEADEESGATGRKVRVCNRCPSAEQVEFSRHENDLQVGWQKASDGKWRYYNADGSMATGWKKLSGKWYYLDPSSGAMATGWEKIKGTWYYFATGGAMQTGWQDIKGKRYHFTADGAMETGWKQVDGTWYLFAKGGAMQTGWQDIKGKRYHLDPASGAMSTAWKKIDGAWYYFAKGGAMQTGWLKLSGKWYYLNSGGSMATGWKQVKGAWYHFASGGVMDASRWVSGKYYVGKSGAMLTSAYTPDGYWVGADGKWDKSVPRKAS